MIPDRLIHSSSPLPSMLATRSGVLVKSDWNPETLVKAAGALLVVAALAGLLQELGRA